MSIRAIAWALAVKTGSSSAKLVLVKLADNANDAGVCWPSLSHICDHTELSERAVRTQIRTLESLDLLTTERRFVEGVQIPNVYRLNLPQTVGVGHQMPGGGAVDTPPVGHQMPPKETVTSKPSSNPKSSADAEPSGFQEFYEKYPRREGRRTAARAFRAALARGSPDQIMAGSARYGVATLGRERQFVKLPATWLNGDHWKDEGIEEAQNGHRKPNGSRPTSTDQHLAGISSLISDIRAGAKPSGD